LATIEGEWLSLSRCAMKAYLRLWVLNSYVLLKYVLTACFGLLRAEDLRNFHLETDVPRSRILELMSQASVYLDPPVAEAAASGLVPVVYRDGGGWTDIASRIDQGLGYASVEEAARTVRSLLNDPGRLKALSARAREVANGFSYERFKERNEVISSLSPDLSAK